MDRKKLIMSFREEVGKWRSKILQLEIGSVEQKASDEVRKWRQNFDTTSSKQLERVLDEIEKRNQVEVSRLANELRGSLAEFKNKHFHRLDELDTFISSTNLDDDLQLDYVKFELDSTVKHLDSLRIDIIVQKVDNSKRRRSSTPLARNTLEFVKVFDFDNTPTASSSSSDRFFKPLRDFVRRASVTGASYYNVGIPGQNKYF